jgi:hypothetical protein
MIDSLAIRAALGPYLLDQTGLPYNLLSLLEDADESAKGLADSIEGLLGLYAAGKLNERGLKAQLHTVLLSELRWGHVILAYSPGYESWPSEETNGTLSLPFFPVGTGLLQLAGRERAGELA